jgi:peptide/nickel transport system permease protein
MQRMTASEAANAPLHRRGARSPAWEHFTHNPAGLFGLAVIVLSIVIAVFGPLLTPYDPHEDVGQVFAPPSWAHPMGTDNLARDVFSRFIVGTRVSLMVGLTAASLATLIGLLVGAAAGYLGGRTDSFLMRLVDIVLIIPLLVLGMAVAAIIGASIVNIILIIALLSWPGTARLVRGEFLSIRERDYVRAAHAVGSSSWWIVFREILPNVLPVIIVAWSFEVGTAIIVEAGLSFLGLGDIQAGSWGIMLHDAQRFLRDAWWMSVFPGIGIALAVLSANLLGEALNDAWNPRLRGR